MTRTTRPPSAWRSRRRFGPATALGFLPIVVVVVAAGLGADRSLSSDAQLAVLAFAGLALLLGVGFDVVRRAPDRSRLPLGSKADAKRLVADHLRALGHEDALPTPSGLDAVLDVVGTEVAAHVVLSSSPADVADVLELSGAASRYERPLLYSEGGFTDAAVESADERGVALLAFDRAGRVAPVNVVARNLIPTEADRS